MNNQIYVIFDRYNYSRQPQNYMHPIYFVAADRTYINTLSSYIRFRGLSKTPKNHSAMMN
jgi:hypothetical protein